MSRYRCACVAMIKYWRLKTRMTESWMEQGVRKPSECIVRPEHDGSSSLQFGRRIPPPDEKPTVRTIACHGGTVGEIIHHRNTGAAGLRACHPPMIAPAHLRRAEHRPHRWPCASSYLVTSC